MPTSTKLAAAVATICAFLSTAALAGGPPPANVPEPATWALVGLAAAIGFVATRNKRK